MQTILKTAYGSGLGYTWLGVSDVYDEGRWRYWSSGKDYDELTGAFRWDSGEPNGGDDQNYGCTNGEHLHDCNSNLYALCEISSDIC